MLALTFDNKDDYEKIQEDDTIDLADITEMAPGSKIQMILNHADGSMDVIPLNHSYNQQQIEWFKAGGALNVIREEATKKKEKEATA